MSARGFSLVETMVAGTMFLLVVGGVVSAWRGVVALRETQHRRLAAIALGEDVLDDLRLRFRGDDDLDSGVHERCFTFDRAAAACPQPRGYTARWDVVDMPGRSFVRIDLLVRWTGGDGLAHAVPFVTYRGRGG